MSQEKGYGPAGAFTEAEWKGMNAQERRKARYDKWYADNKAQRNEARRARYKKDKEHRGKILSAAKSRRPAIRAQKAKEKFEDMVASNRARILEKEKDRGTSAAGRKGHPRYVRLSNNWAGWVHTTRELGLRVGRAQATISAWIERRVLPGCTTKIGVSHYFSEPFMDAVVAACERLYYRDGNGSRDLLRELILEELIKAKVSWLPPDGAEFDRVQPGAK